VAVAAASANVEADEEELLKVAMFFYAGLLLGISVDVP
jgi:hypothetical protein